MKRLIFFLFFMAIGFGFMTFTKAAAQPEEFSPALVECMQSALGTERYLALTLGQLGKNYQPTATEKTQVGNCLTINQPTLITPQGLTAKNTDDIALPAEVLTCMQEKVPGFSEALARRQKGERVTPTTTQQETAKECFNSYDQSGRVIGTKQITHSEESPSKAKTETTEMMYNCFGQVLGTERVAAMRDGKSRPTTEEEKKVKQNCVDKYSEDFRPSELSKSNKRSDSTKLTGMSDEQRSCLAELIGQDKMQAMLDGTFNPSESQKKQMISKCFNEEHKQSNGLYVRPDNARDSQAYANHDVPNYLKNCLTTVFGASGVESMQNNQLNPTGAQTEQLTTCRKEHYSASSDNYPQPTIPSSPPTFLPVRGQGGDTPPPTRGNDTVAPLNTDTAVPPVLPADLSQIVTHSEACKQAALGANYEPYQRGEYYPTPDEYTKMSACYK